MNLSGLDMNNPLQVAESMINQNNAWNAEQVEKQIEFQREMSNTAHQREVQDLQAAGLNPVLSAQTNGASTPSGAKAEGDMSAMTLLYDLLSQSIAQNSWSSAYGAAVSAGENKINPSKSEINQIRTSAEQKGNEKYLNDGYPAMKPSSGKENHDVREYIKQSAASLKNKGYRIFNPAINLAEAVELMLYDAGLPIQMGHPLFYGRGFKGYTNMLRSDFRKWLYRRMYPNGRAISAQTGRF